jgi:hypothetical protein
VTIGPKRVGIGTEPSHKNHRLLFRAGRWLPLPPRPHQLEVPPATVIFSHATPFEEYRRLNVPDRIQKSRIGGYRNWFSVHQETCEFRMMARSLIEQRISSVAAEFNFRRGQDNASHAVGATTELRTALFVRCHFFEERTFPPFPIRKRTSKLGERRCT